MDTWVFFIALAAGTVTSGGGVNVFSHCLNSKTGCQSEAFVLNEAIS